MQRGIVSLLRDRNLGRELGSIHEGLITLREAGMTRGLWQRLTESNELASRVISFAERSGHILTPSQERAKEIMGQNFFGPGEVSKYLGLTFTKEELFQLADLPWEEEVLDMCRDTHVCFPGISHWGKKPLTIQCLEEMGWIDPNLQPMSPSEPWYRKEEFSFKETPGLRWYLIRNSVLPESLFKPYPQQVQLLKEHEYVEKAVVYCFGMLLCLEVRRERLFSDDNPYTMSSIWCSDVATQPRRKGLRVTVSYRERAQIQIDDRDENEVTPRIGLLPAYSYP